MSVIEKLYTVIIFAAVIVGISIGQMALVQAHAELFIVPLLIAMLYVTFLQIPIEKLKQAFRNLKFTHTSVLINFVWTPIVAWLLASLFLGDSPALYLGFIMLMVTPCTDWYLLFTGMAKGNVALSTAILPLNLILQIILLPVYLLIFDRTTGVVNLGFLVESVIIVLLVPLTLALLTNRLLKAKRETKEKLLARLSVLPSLFLSLAIVAMFASHGSLLLENLDLLWTIMLPILLFFVINLVVSQWTGRMMKFTYSERASLSLTTLARNSPTALAIAMTAFPDEPLIALTLVIGPLLELPILAVITQFLLFLRAW